MTDSTTSEEVISITEAGAAHMLKLIRSEDEFTEESGIRVQMIPGGCSGMKYDFQFAKQQGPGEDVEEYFGLKLFVPAAWKHFLKGTSIDYTESLQGSGMKIENPNIKRSCGCGKSVS
jgi:iron-sulfur cluster assembly accessory protein